MSDTRRIALFRLTWRWCLITKLDQHTFLSDYRSLSAAIFEHKTEDLCTSKTSDWVTNEMSGRNRQSKTKRTRLFIAITIHESVFHGRKLVSCTDVQLMSNILQNWISYSSSYFFASYGFFSRKYKRSLDVDTIIGISRGIMWRWIAVEQRKAYAAQISSCVCRRSQDFLVNSDRLKTWQDAVWFCLFCVFDARGKRTRPSEIPRALFPSENSLFPLSPASFSLVFHPSTNAYALRP